MAQFDASFTIFPDLPLEIRLMIWRRALPGPRVIELRQRKLKKTIGQWEQENGTLWPIPPDVDEMIDMFSFSGDSEHTAAFRIEIEENMAEFIEEQRQQVASFIDRNNDGSYKSSHLMGYHSDAQAPAILFVCKESYSVASEFYERAFSSAYSLPQTWINAQLDTLYLRLSTFSPYIVSESRLEVFHNLLHRGFRLADKDTLCQIKQLAVSMDEFDGSLESHVALYANAFGNLEEFTFVLEHYQDGEDDHTDLVIMDNPVDYKKVCALYENVNDASPGSSNRLDHHELDIKISEIPLLSTRKVDVSDVREAYSRHAEIGMMRDPWPTIEKFDSAVVLTERCTEKLAQLETRCRRLLEEAGKQQ